MADLGLARGDGWRVLDAEAVYVEVEPGENFPTFLRRLADVVEVLNAREAAFQCSGASIEYEGDGWSATVLVQ